jgi:hypothetical protein
VFLFFNVSALTVTGFASLARSQSRERRVQKFRTQASSIAINCVVADIKTNNGTAFYVEDGTEIGLDGDGIDRPAKLGG